MAKINGDYPYPILTPANNDYIDTCFFTTTIGNDISVSEQSIFIPISYSYQSELLSRLIADRRAFIAVRVSSPSVSYSRLFPFNADNNTQVLKIEKFDVKDKIEIQGLAICTSAAQLDGNSPDLNPNFFSGLLFNVDKGDTLAQDEVKILYIDDSELEKPVSSIFSVHESTKQEQSIVPYFDGEKIDVYLAPDLYKLYYQYAYKNGGMLERFATGSIIFPVLVEAIDIIRSRSNEEDDPRWQRAIVDKCEKQGIRLYDQTESAVTLADMLLGGITLSCMRTFNVTADSEINSGAIVEDRRTD